MSPNTSSITLTDEQFRELLASIRNAASDRSMRGRIPPPVAPQSGNFAKGNAQFNGSVEADMDAFIDDIMTKVFSKTTSAEGVKEIPVQGVTSARHSATSKPTTGRRTGENNNHEDIAVKPPPSEGADEPNNTYHFVEDSKLAIRPSSDGNSKPEQEQAFKPLKRLPTTATILKQADRNLPYDLKTDARDCALGAVLMQGESPERHSTNTSQCDSTEFSAAYLSFGRERKTEDDAHHDFRAAVDADISDPTTPLGAYQTTALAPYVPSNQQTAPVRPIRGRGRPRKNESLADPTTTECVFPQRGRPRREPPPSAKAVPSRRRARGRPRQNQLVVQATTFTTIVPFSGSRADPFRHHLLRGRM